MKKKTLITAASLIALLSLGVVSVSAQVSSTGSAKGTKGEQVQADRMTARKAKADAEIDRRITALNGLITRINAIKKLSSTNKTTLTSQIQTEISSLTTLKAKIDADTDLPTLNTDIQSVVTDHRIYMLFVPKTHILAASDVVLQTNDIFANIQTQIQAKINAAKAAGQDVTALQTALTDMQSKVAYAATQANNAASLVTPLVPDKTTNYTPTLQSARKDLQTAKQDLQAARQDVETILHGLGENKTNISSSSPSLK